MNFYTSVKVVRGKIGFRGIENGKRVTKLIGYSPSLFVPNNNPDIEVSYSSIHDRPLEKIKFSKIDEARDYIKTYKDVENYEIYGTNKFEYAFIAEKFGDRIIEWNMSLLRILNIDIEVDPTDGMPNIAQANRAITAITCEVDGFYTVFGYKDGFDKFAMQKINIDPEKIDFILCQNESDLLMKFLEFWSSDYPDIITGYNINFFDIPYLVHRITRLFSEEVALRLSPWKVITSRQITMQGKMQTQYELWGINSLDWIDLFKKFAVDSSQESYRLDYIADYVLGIGKLDYGEYKNLQTLYIKNYQLFIEYNIRDVELVRKLENKRKLMELALNLAYDTKCNPQDVMSQVRMWTQIIYNFLYQENRATLLPIYDSEEEVEGYEGAFVQEPQKGMFKWVASFDLTSLYPMIVMQWNVSPDTIIDQEAVPVTVDGLLDRKYDLGFLKEQEMAMTANGHKFDISKKGFLPKILDRMFQDRNYYKNLMIENEKKLVEIEEEMKKRGLEVKKLD